MEHQLFAEHAILNFYVKDIWTLQSESLKNSSKTFRCFADGSPGIMFHQADHNIFLNKNEKKLSSLFLYGQTVKPIEIAYRGNFRIVIIYFYPHVIKSLFGIEAKELTDTCLDFELLPFAGINELLEQLTESISVEKQVRLLTHFLLNLIDKNKTLIERDLQYVTSNLTNAGGNVPLKVLQNELNISERTFERKFLQHVGVSPRLFARICRFHAALGQMRSNNYQKLTDIAYESGFADQSHFIRTFKEFTGLTPREYLVQYQMMSEEQSY